MYEKIYEAHSNRCIGKILLNSQKNSIGDYTGEMLTPEEFSRRMNVCRTIVYQMMADNRLLPGRHYILLNTKKRFPWGADLIRKLLVDSIDFGTRNRGRNQPLSIQKKSTADNSEQMVRVKSKTLPFVNLD